MRITAALAFAAGGDPRPRPGGLHRGRPPAAGTGRGAAVRLRAGQRDARRRDRPRTGGGGCGDGPEAPTPAATRLALAVEAMAEPDWLTWARDLQAIAQTGLTFSRDHYGRERDERLRAMASQVMAAHTGSPAERIEALFAGEAGYVTPKVDVRGAVCDGAGRLLLVREIADGGRWTLPGGWADVNFTAAENVVKEVREESGDAVRVRKLAATWDRTRQGHPAGVFSCCKLFFVCDLAGGAAATGPTRVTACRAAAAPSAGWRARRRGRAMPQSPYRHAGSVHGQKSTKAWQATSTCTRPGTNGSLSRASLTLACSRDGTTHTGGYA